VDSLSVSAQPPAPQPDPSPPPPAAEPPRPAASALLSAEEVLLAIAAADGPWFPSRFAEAAGVPRDALDEPLTELRLAGLVKVAEWVRGLGQGYALTPEGRAAAGDPIARERVKQALAAAGAVGAPPALLPAPDDAPEAAVEPVAAARDTELVLNPPIVVPALLMTNVLWFSVCAVWSIRWGLTPARALSESHLEVLHRFGAVGGPDLIEGEWWRLLSSCFVHVGAFHLLLNMLALAMMGPLAELLWGRGRLLLIYVVSGLAGSSLAMALRPDSLLAGASGAIWGIQMSLFAWLFAFRTRLPPELASDWFRRLTVVFVVNAGASFLPNVSWEGHLGGGAAGFLVAGLLNAARFGDRPRRASAWLLIALMPVMCVAGVAAAMDAKGMAGWQRLRQKMAAEQEFRDALDQRQKLIEENRRLREAQTEFNNELIPRLQQLAPEVVRPVETEAGLLLALSRRSPERVAAAQARVQGLKGAADAVVQLATREPSGSESFDHRRERARAFGAARAKSFELLLGLLATTGPVPADAWEAWQASRREADRLWGELTAK
jgi:rhomboid protease GluP